MLRSNYFQLGMTLHMALRASPTQGTVDEEVTIMVDTCAYVLKCRWPLAVQLTCQAVDIKLANELVHCIFITCRAYFIFLPSILSKPLGLSKSPKFCVTLFALSDSFVFCTCIQGSWIRRFLPFLSFFWRLVISGCPGYPNSQMYFLE